MEARGQLHQRYRGVSIYGHPDLSWKGDFLAAQYACGETAHLTWGTALACHRLWRPYTRQIHVMATTKRRGRQPTPEHPAPEVFAHRTKLVPRPEEIKHEGPLRDVRLPRRLFEFVPDSNEKQLKALIEKAVQPDKLDHDTEKIIARGSYGAA